MDFPFGPHNHQHLFSLRSFTDWQRTKIKGHLTDVNNRSYSVFSLFSPLHPEFSPSSRIIDIFSNFSSFNLSNKKKNDKTHLHQLDSMVIELLLSPSTAITITDTSIKNYHSCLVHSHSKQTSI